MIIGIDIDDTISDTYEVMISYAQEYSINNLGIEPSFRTGNCPTHLYIQYLLGWDNNEDEGFFKTYYEKIITEVKPKTLAIDYLKRLHDEGHKIVLITARFESDDFDVRKITKNWIEKFDVPCDELIINAENKLVACKEQNVDLFIDDSFKNCKMVSDGGIKSYIMDSRGNQELNDDNIERVYSWPHVYLKIKQN